MANLSPVQRELARHALGLPTRGGRSYRNSFVAGPDHDDYVHWLAMVADGNAVRYAGRQLFGWDDLFRLTPTGAEAALDPGEKLCPDDFPHVERANG